MIARLRRRAETVTLTDGEVDLIYEAIDRRTGIEHTLLSAVDEHPELVALVLELKTCGLTISTAVARPALEQLRADCVEVAEEHRALVSEGYPAMRRRLATSRWSREDWESEIPAWTEIAEENETWAEACRVLIARAGGDR